jgi:hypothetical protein
MRLPVIMSLALSIAIFLCGCGALLYCQTIKT